jgi:hypothetical protein
MADPPRPRRNLLFVPGSRPDRFEKALAHRPDMVTVDLEDAVIPAHKDGARAEAMALFDRTRKAPNCSAASPCTYSGPESMKRAASPCTWTSLHAARTKWR